MRVNASFRRIFGLQALDRGEHESRVPRPQEIDLMRSVGRPDGCETACVGNSPPVQRVVQTDDRRATAFR